MGGPYICPVCKKVYHKHKSDYQRHRNKYLPSDKKLYVDGEVRTQTDLNNFLEAKT